MNPFSLIDQIFMYQKLLRNEKLKPIELKKYQNKKIRALIKHSYENVPYYHSLLKKARIAPDDIKTIDDLRKIPISSKKNIRDATLKEIAAKNTDINSCILYSTSGSSGIPIKIPWNHRAFKRYILTHIRWTMDCGNKITNRTVQIGFTFLPTNNPLQKMGLFKVKNIDAKDPIDKQIDEIMRFRPNTFFCPPSCARLIAIEKRELEIDEIKPSLIFTGGEIFDDYTRKLLHDAFEAEIYDHYGCNEAGGIAYECNKHEGYHIRSDLIAVEVTRDGEMVSEGEKGEIIVTNLHNYTGPIIRYNLEDIGFLVEEECSCGRSFPLMKLAEGRGSDIILLPDGRIISTIVLHQLLVISGIKQYRVIQEKEDLFLVKIMKDSLFSDKTFEEIEKKLKGCLGDVKIDVETVDRIPVEKSGKFKSFISKVSVK